MDVSGVLVLSGDVGFVLRRFAGELFGDGGVFVACVVMRQSILYNSSTHKLTMLHSTHIHDLILYHQIPFPTKMPHAKSRPYKKTKKEQQTSSQEKNTQPRNTQINMKRMGKLERGNTCL